MKIEERQYQTDTWERLAQERALGNKFSLVVLATGLGKTFTAVVDVKNYIEEVKQTIPNPRILFTAHITDILREAQDTFDSLLPNADVTLKTLQSLHATLDQYPRDYFDYIVYDEAHHMQAKTFKEVQEHFTPRFTLALTATPERGDGQDITKLFDQPLVEKTLPEAIAHGHLAKVHYKICFDEAVKNAIDKKFEKTAIRSMTTLINVEKRNRIIAKGIEQEIKKLDLEHAPTILFCQTIKHAEEMAEILGGKAYHAKLPKAEKDQIFDDFKNEKLEIICTRDMFNEGVNIPNTRLVIFLRSTSSRTIFIQQLGRGLRKAPNKEHLTVLDYVANIERLQHIKDLMSDIGDFTDIDEITEQELGEEDEELEFISKFAFGEFIFTHEVIKAMKKLNIISKLGISDARFKNAIKRKKTTTPPINKETQDFQSEEPQMVYSSHFATHERKLQGT